MYFVRKFDGDILRNVYIKGVHKLTRSMHMDM